MCRGGECAGAGGGALSVKGGGSDCTGASECAVDGGSMCIGGSECTGVGQYVHRGQYVCRQYGWGSICAGVGAVSVLGAGQ